MPGPEGQTCQSVGRMRLFDGMVLENLEKKITPKMVGALLKKFESLGLILVILQIGTFRLQTYRPGRPVLINGKHQMYILLVVFIFLSQALRFVINFHAKLFFSFFMCVEESAYSIKCCQMI